MPGNVDQREAAPVGQLERRVAEVDRDPARLLLRETVGVLAGERADEPRLAVVDVPGGADGQRHRASITSRRRSASQIADSAVKGSRAMCAHRACDLVELILADRSAVEEEPSVAHDPDDRRVAEAKRLRERLIDRARERRQLGERQRSAADAGDRLLHLASDGRREALGARANRCLVLVQHP